MKQFKERLDNLSYDEILEHRFRTLETDVYSDVIFCTFTMDNNVWKAMKKAGHIGSLYNCDLSNYLYRKGILLKYCVPTVNDKNRAKNGIKTIEVTFYLDRNY